MRLSSDRSVQGVESNATATALEVKLVGGRDVGGEVGNEGGEHEHAADDARPVVDRQCYPFPPLSLMHTHTHTHTHTL